MFQEGRPLAGGRGLRRRGANSSRTILFAVGILTPAPLTGIKVDAMTQLSSMIAAASRCNTSIGNGAQSTSVWSTSVCVNYGCDGTVLGSLTLPCKPRR